MNLSRNILISLILGAFLLGLVSLLSSLDREYKKLSKDLSDALDVQAHISHIIKELGYMGFIHNFKNYLLRGDESYYLATTKNFKSLDFLLQHQPSIGEDLVMAEQLQLIKQTVQEYERNLELVRQYHHQGLSLSEIDSRVRVDDELAAQAISQLISQLQLNASMLLKNISQDQNVIRKQLRLTIFITMFVAVVVCLFGWYLAVGAWVSRRTSDQLTSKQKLLDAAINPIIIVSERGDIVVANRGAERLFGVDKEQLVGRSVEDYIDERLQISHQTNRDAFFRSQGGRTMLNPVLLHIPGGEKKEIEVQIGLYEVDGERFAVANLLDVSNVTNLRRKAEQMEQHFRATFEMAPIGIAQVSLEGRFLKVNKKMEEIFGYSRHEMELKHIVDVTYKEDVDVSKYVMGRFQNNDTDYFRMEKRYQSKDGRIVWANLTSTLYRDELGKPEYLISIIEDISQRKKFEADLLESEAKFKTIANHVNGVVWMATPGMAQILFVSEHFEKLWGIPVEVIKKRPTAFLDAILEADKPRVLEAIKSHRQGEWNVQYRIKAADGKVHYIHDEGNPVRAADGTILYLVGLGRDVTNEHVAREKLEQTNKQLEQLAKFDPLTMAVRRQYALVDFDECIALHKRYGSDASLIFIDLNNFKMVNDRYGHEGGDRVLIEFARYIRANIRETDGFYRYAGDEFLVLLRETNTAQAEHFILKLHNTLLEVDLEEKGQISVGFACGACSLSGNNIVDANQWVNLADEEMYRVKHKLKTSAEASGFQS